MVIEMLLLATLGISMAILVIPLVLMLIFLYQGNTSGVVGAGAFLLFLLFPELCLILLIVGAFASLLIGRPDLSRTCVICFVVFIVIYAILIIAGIATIMVAA